MKTSMFLFILVMVQAGLVAFEVWLYATTGSAVALAGIVFCVAMLIITLINWFRISSY